jgi:uncharacterized protein YjiS (DUF1127 family)
LRLGLAILSRGLDDQQRREHWSGLSPEKDYDMSVAGSEFQTAAMPRLAARVVQAIRAAWARYISRCQRWRELCELRAMDDMSLKDIGITRLDIRAAIRSGVDLESARN